MPPWPSVKAKVQLRLSVQRLRSLQRKKEAVAKSTRYEIAMLLERGKVETAGVKTESLINEDIHTELLELLELSCELLLARFGLLDQITREPDPGVSEGVCNIVYAAPRTELKELHVLRDILMHKYGREFSKAVMENQDHRVSDRIVRKATLFTPPPELVSAYLQEIAKGYGIAWRPEVTKSETGNNDEEESGDGDVKADVAAKDTSQSAGGDTETDPLSEKKPIGGAPPTDVRPPELPDLPPTEDGDDKGTPAAASSTRPKASTPEDDVEALMKRFAALKKR